MLRGLLFGASLLVFSAQAVAQAQAESKTRVNLRSGLGPPTKIVAVLEKGEVVTVLGTEGEYAKVVTVEDETGFVRQSYLIMRERPAAAMAKNEPAAQPVPVRTAPEPVMEKAPADATPASPRPMLSGVDDWPGELRPGQKVQPPPKRIYTPRR